MRVLRFAIAAVLAVLFCAACGPAGGLSDPQPQARAFEETGDLAALKKRGKLRILLPAEKTIRLTRRGFTDEHELELARELSRQLGLAPTVIRIADRSQLLDALERGTGDLVLARLAATEDRRKRFTFSTPIDHVREILVTRSGFPPLTSPRDMAGMRVAVRRSSSFYETIRQFQPEIPFEIVIVPETEETEQLIYRVAMRDFDATVADEDLLEAVLAYRDDVRAALPLTKPRPIGWALRRDMPELKNEIDQFLQRYAMTEDMRKRFYGDLEQIKERKVLRLLTRNNAASYFLYRGEERGFEFELAQALARELGCRLQIVLPPNGNLLIPWLLEGRGDLVAASLTIRPSREAWVDFSQPYLEPREVIVVRADDQTILTEEDLRGRTIHLRRSSSYFDTLSELQPSLGFNMEFVPATMETEELIAAVAAGEFEITIADSHILAIEMTYRTDVRAAFPVGEQQGIGWAIRKEDKDLMEAANSFLQRSHRSEFFNVIQSKYFRDEKRIRKAANARLESRERISPYDALFRRHGQLNELDWRLLAAQAYEESRFDWRAHSHAGAIGVMQLMPRTAREVGVYGDLRDPGTNIEAGSAYLRKLIGQFEDDLEFSERLRFALASYNAGRGHIEDGRRLAREHGLDPNRWFGHVAKVLPLLSKREYAVKARYGYCRCRQSTAYVQSVNDRYAIYARIYDNQEYP